MQNLYKIESSDFKKVESSSFETQTQYCRANLSV